jgi:hypothetical protein
VRNWVKPMWRAAILSKLTWFFRVRNWVKPMWRVAILSPCLCKVWPA